MAPAALKLLHCHLFPVSRIHVFLIRSKLSDLSLDVSLIFCQIQPEMFLKCFLTLKTSTDNNGPH